MGEPEPAAWQQYIVVVCDGRTKASGEDAMLTRTALT